MKKKRLRNKPPKAAQEEEQKALKKRRALEAERQTGLLPREILEANQHLPQPVSHEMLLQMQQTHGNGYVQHFLTRLSQRQQFGLREEEERVLRSPESSAKLAERSAYSSETEATISADGQLELDIERMLDLKRYSDVARAYRHQVQEWKGAAAVDLNQESFGDNEVGLQTDGTLTLQLGPQFVRALEQVENPKHAHEKPEMGYGRPFKARVRATLHYHSQDPKLRQVDVDKTKRQNIQDAEAHKGLYLKLEIESVYRLRVGRTEEEKELTAEVVLAADIQG